MMKTKQQKNNSVTVVNKDQIQSYIQVEDEAVQQAVFDKFLQLVNEGSGDDE